MNDRDLSVPKLQEYLKLTVQSQDDWDTMNNEIDSILQAKVQDRCQAYVLWKRAECGLLAWTWINAWYMQVAGMGISALRGKLMNPTQSKKDADVQADVQQWLDDEKELMAMGEEELGSDTK